MRLAIQPFSHSAIQPFSHSAIQPFSHYIPFRRAVLCIPIIIAFISPNNSFAERIFVTPGSLAGYVYYPPIKNGASGGGEGGEDSSTLQRCTFSPTQGDQTVTVNAEKLYEYTKPIQLQYTIAGGDGGGGLAGGGGGSSAILLNGAVVVVAPGGDGGEGAREVRGRITLKANDRIRFVSGGGGGGGMAFADSMGGQVTVGGGGGAGWRGGGAGGSHPSRSIDFSESKPAAGRGGAGTPGQGGNVDGGTAGTSGSGSQGGVSTFPDGSSLSQGFDNGGVYRNTGNVSGDYVSTFKLVEPQVYRLPATENRAGSMSKYFLKSYYRNYPTPTAIINGSTTNLLNWGSNFLIVYGGGGGSLGRSGFPAFMVHHGGDGLWYGPGYEFQYIFNSNVNVMNNRIGPVKVGETIRSLPAHNYDLNLTRPVADDSKGANPGQIVTSYQAPICGLLE